LADERLAVEQQRMRNVELQQANEQLQGSVDAAQEALRWIAGSVKSRQGAAVLDALELLDGDVLKPRESRYAKHVLELLSQKGQGQVLNRAELVQPEAGVDYWTRFRLEPEFLVVVAAALVHSGDVVLSLAGKKLDAASIDQFAKLSIGDAREFKHVERPKDLPLGSLQELCDLLGVPKGLIVNPATRDEAVAQLQQRVGELLGKVVTAQARVVELVFWGKPVLSEQEQNGWGIRLGGLKTFLESLQPFNTAGKLKNFPHEASAVKGQKSALDLTREVEDLLQLVQQVAPLTSYLGKAEALLDATHAWQEEVRTSRTALLTKIGSPKHRADASFQRLLGQTLAELKSKYQDAYVAGHERARLGANDDKKKAAFTKDPRLAQLQKLAGIEMMPTQQLREFENRLFALKTCFQLGKPELEADPICPHCSFRPAEELGARQSSGKVLHELDEALDGLVQSWTQTLLTNLDDPTVAGNVDLVTDAKGKRELRDFIKSKSLPEPVTPAFVKALQEVLSGLQKVVVTVDELRMALADGGLPCTVGDLRERFERHLGKLTKGRDASKVRLVIE